MKPSDDVEEHSDPCPERVVLPIAAFLATALVEPLRETQTVRRLKDRHQQQHRDHDPQNGLWHEVHTDHHQKEGEDQYGRVFQLVGLEVYMRVRIVHGPCGLQCG